MNVIVHPLVLLSVVDHYNRVVGEHQTGDSRVAGILLGQIRANGAINITNSYAVPFEEDKQNPKVWFFDHNYHTTMSELFRKVSIKEVPVGWYHTGPKLAPNDMAIHRLVRKHIPVAHPVLVVLDEKDDSNFLKAYVAAQESDGDGWTFDHVPLRIEAEEAEEIGVEHLLRDVRDHRMNRRFAGQDAEPLSILIESRIGSLKQLRLELNNIERFLDQVLSSNLPQNNEILEQVQGLFSRPNVFDSEEWKRSLMGLSNDGLVCIYVASLVRTATALHSLIDNKLQTVQEETPIRQTS